MADVWFTADTHFGHKNVIKFCDRPYETMEEMNEGLIENFNELIKPEDTLYHMGDAALPARFITEVSKLNGHKHLILGNHDLPWPKFPHGKARRYMEAGFESMTLYNHIQLGEHLVKLSHMPYEVGIYDERYADFHPTDRGLPLLHGHVHSEWLQRGRQINVGVDVWDMRPVHADTLIERINKM